MTRFYPGGTIEPMIIFFGLVKSQVPMGIKLCWNRSDISAIYTLLLNIAIHTGTTKSLISFWV